MAEDDQEQAAMFAKILGTKVAQAFWRVQQVSICIDRQGQPFQPMQQEENTAKEGGGQQVPEMRMVDKQPVFATSNLD